VSDITEFMDDFERRTFARIAVMAARWRRDPVDAAVTDVKGIPENLKKTGGNIAAETVGLAGDLQPIAETLSPALKGRKRLPTSEELVSRWGGDRDHWSSIPAMFAAPGPGEVKAGLLTAKAALKGMLGLSKEMTAGVALATSILGGIPTRGAKLPNETIYVKNWGRYGQPLEILQNPSTQEVARLRKDIRAQFHRDGLNPNANPLTRETFDADGNRWVWNSSNATHDGAEQQIRKRIGDIELNQNQPGWERKPEPIKAADNALAGGSVRAANVADEGFIQVYHGFPTEVIDSVKSGGIASSGDRARGATFASPRADTAFAYIEKGGEKSIKNELRRPIVPDNERALAVLRVPESWYKKHAVQERHGGITTEVGFDADITHEFIHEIVVGDRAAVYKLPTTNLPGVAPIQFGKPEKSKLDKAIELVDKY